MIKKFSFTNKTVALLLAVSLSTIVFAGCQNKNSKAAAKPSANSSRQYGAGVNLDQFKQRISDNIQSLVDDNTITKDQADKIVAALTENMKGLGGQNRQKNNQNNNQGNGQNNSQNNNQGNGQNRQGGRENSAISKLVTDGVITQAQADAVMQKVKGNFNRPQSQQSNQNNQGV